jgi:hypothetical protein
VIRAENFEALFDYALALAMQPLPKGEPGGHHHQRRRPGHHGRRRREKRWA